jgi:hypothetical protein
MLPSFFHPPAQSLQGERNFPTAEKHFSAALSSKVQSQKDGCWRIHQQDMGNSGNGQFSVI